MPNKTTDVEISKESVVYAKAAMLTNGIGIDFDAIRHLSGYKREDFGYNSSHHISEAEKKLVPQELLLTDLAGRTSAASCVNYRTTPYKLVFVDGAPRIQDVNTGEYLQVRVELLKHPPFRDSKTPDGTPVNRVISNCGLCEVNVWLWHDCAFYTEHEACKFCGINSIANKFAGQDLLRISEITGMSKDESTAWWQKKRERTIENAVAALAEALKYDFGGHKHLIFTAGSSIDTDPQWSIYYEVMKAVNERVTKLSGLETTVILTPPRDLSLIDRIADFGVQFAFNPEVYHRELFKQLAPGKQRHVSWEHYLEAYRHALDLVGEGKVWAGFVFGLEPAESLLSGIEELNSMGVAAGANILHMDHGNTLPSGIRVPKTEDALRFYKRYGEIVRSSGLRPFFCEKAMRTSLNHEAFLGWI